MIVRKKLVAPIDFAGLTIHDLTGAKSLSSSIAIIDVPVGGSHVLARSKRSDKYYLVLEGTIRFTVEAEEADVETGDLCFVPQGSKFRYRNPGTQAARLVLIHTPGFALEDEEFFDDGHR